MKNLIFPILTLLLLTLSMSLNAQAPSPPNNGNGTPSEDNNPVGGGAPIASGIIVLMELGIAYGFGKTYQLVKTENK